MCLFSLIFQLLEFRLVYWNLAIKQLYFLLNRQPKELFTPLLFRAGLNTISQCKFSFLRTMYSLKWTDFIFVIVLRAIGNTWIKMKPPVSFCSCLLPQIIPHILLHLSFVSRHSIATMYVQTKADKHWWRAWFFNEYWQNHWSPSISTNQCCTDDGLDNI